MRVRPIKPNSRLRAGTVRRQWDASDRTAQPAPPAPEPAAPQMRPLRDVRADRIRSAGGPEDQACYRCSCGYVFETAVSTSVRCPNCGDGQAW